MNVLGIDPGSKRMGYALVSPWDNREFRPRKPILIGATVHTSKDVERRMVAAQTKMEEILCQCRAHGPFTVVYEEPPSQWRSGNGGNGRKLNQRASFMLGQACGMVRAVNHHMGNPTTRAIPVSSWRKIARQLGMIKADPKADAVKWIESRLELSVGTDAAEAYMLAVAFISCPSIAR